MKRTGFFILGLLFAFSATAQNLYYYIAQAYKKQFFSPVGCRDFFAYKLLDSAFNGNVHTYYLILYVQGYKIDKGYLQECGATFTPAVLKLEDASSASLSLPAEGEDYSASIRNLFPPYLHKKVFSFYKYMDAGKAKIVTRDSAVRSFHLVAVKIFYPANWKKYDELFDAYVNGQGPNPIGQVTFHYSTVYMADTPDIKRKAALMAYRKYPPFSNPQNASIAYFKQQRDSVYILLNADVDAWAGVNFFLARVHPIIEKTLLQFPDVSTVVWDRCPCDK